MDVPHAAYERSLERSYLRLRVLLVLSSLGEAFPRQLARACDVDCWRLDQILFGDGEGGDYSMDLSLIRLGLAEVVQTQHGKLYRITAAGRRKARRLAARARRREDFRRANREQRELRVDPFGRDLGSPRVWPRPEPHDSGPVATPEASPPQDAIPPDSLRWPVEE